MALADALELPGTYGIAHDRVVVLIAGGRQALVDLAGAPEDDPQDVIDEFAPAARQGRLPDRPVGQRHDTLCGRRAGRSGGVGAATVGIANNAGTPLVTKADIGIVLATPPEMVAGSTRMGAGTAQKIALNMFSTLVAIHLGHVHDGYMVNLRRRQHQAARPRRAHRLGDRRLRRGRGRRLAGKTGGQVKPAILLAAGARTPTAANELLEGNGQKLRPALAGLKEGSIRSHRN